MIGEPIQMSATKADSNTGIDGPQRICGAERGRTPRHPWTERDRSRLRVLCEQNLPSSDIAKLLGRTLRAVDAMSQRMGLCRHEAARPWTESECATILRLHAEGATWAGIVDAVPGRSAIAVFRKLSHLVGPAPFKLAGHAMVPATPVRPPSERQIVAERQAVAERQSRSLRLRPAPPLPPPAVPASLDAMVRWLRSRDFVVLRLESGWRVDHHVLATTEALVEFVNIRRGRIRLPPFSLLEGERGAAPAAAPAPTPANGATATFSRIRWRRRESRANA